MNECMPTIPWLSIGVTSRCMLETVEWFRIPFLSTQNHCLSLYSSVNLAGLLHGTQSTLRSWWSLGLPRNFTPLLCSQDPLTGPDESNPHVHTLFIYSRSRRPDNLKSEHFVSASHVPHACYMPDAPRPHHT